MFSTLEVARRPTPLPHHPVLGRSFGKRQARERGVRAFHCELAQGNLPVHGLVHEAVPGL